MSTKKTNVKCSGCGGELVFDANNQNLICIKCSSSSNINKENCLIKHEYNIVENIKEDKITHANCSTCGALLNVKEREITKTCEYCGSNFVLELDEINGLKPDLVIPFAFDKNCAIEKFKSGVKKKHFLPNKFKKSPSFSSITSTYISTFSFDSNTHSEYSGTLAIDSSYTDSNGNRRSETTYKHISGNKQQNFENFLIESSSLANQTLFEQIKPYSINENTGFKYNPDFIRGYNVESYQQNLQECKMLSEEMMKSKIKQAILSNYHYSRVVKFSMTTSFNQDKFSYILVPVYFINIDYKNKKYTTYLNGQTGKLGQNLPKSKLKIFFAIFIPILIVASIIGLCVALG